MRTRKRRRLQTRELRAAAPGARVNDIRDFTLQHLSFVLDPLRACQLSGAPCRRAELALMNRR